NSRKTSESHSPLLYQSVAALSCVCSATVRAIQTLTSGKQIIEIEGCQIQFATRFQMNHGQRAPLFSGRGPGWLDLPFDGSHNKLLQGDSTSRGERLCPAK